MRLALALCILALSCPFVPALAQQDEAPDQGSVVLVLNQERLLQLTQFGQRLRQEFEAASAALNNENRRIEALLTEEELALTEQRETMPPDEFRGLADEFDIRVTGIRAAQAAKTRDLQAQTDAAQQRFFEESVPVLLQLIEDRGAAVLLDSRSVLLSADSIDITEEAITQIDAMLGDGGPDPIIELPGLTIEE